MSAERKNRQRNAVVPSRVAPVRQLADLLAVGVVVAGADGSASFANRAWLEMTGQLDVEWRGQGWLDALEASGGVGLRDPLLSAARAGETFSTDWVVRGPDESERALHVTVVPQLAGRRVVRMVATVFDITNQRAATRRLAHQASHDPLTGLYNRAQFLEFLGHALDRRRRDRRRLAAVLFIDVDGLKETNDRHGHSAGDRLLRAAAARISSSVRPQDVVARYGGDEFAVLCDDLQSPEESDSIAARIRSFSRQGDATDESLSLSVGVALADDHHVAPADIVDRADRAMYLARGARIQDEGAEESGRPRQRRNALLQDPETVLAAAAHELLRPVTAINGFATMLREDRNRMSAEDVETAFAVLERQSSSLGGLLEELLELGSSHNRVSRAAEPVLLEDAISDALETAPPPDGKTVIVRPAPTSVSVLGDRRRLARVVVNLLTNAYRYGGSRIVVGLEDRPGQAVLSVEDDGVGVNDDLVPKLFVPFTRGGRRAGSDSDGAGLGLALAREILEATGGSIEYRPAEPHGARLVITLPKLASAPEESVTVPAPSSN
ncbi:MAG TPA: diguanylate cyclase [Acidimicrobiales bacterium]|nr:diguanylate cyclase [Acidimicrobiales bacterium]